MNKKLNSFLFVLIGTLVNILIMIILLFAFFALASLIISRNPEMNQNVQILFFFIAILGSLAGSFVIFSKLSKWANEKWKLEEKLHPIFKRKRK